MSKLLDDLIKQSRADTAAYEEFLQKAEALVKRLAQKQPDGGVPAVLHGKPEAIVLFNNLASIPATTFQCPADDDGKAELALEIDLAMREQAPAGWKGDDSREKQVLNALFPIMARDREATQAHFRDHQEPAGLLMTETIQLGEIVHRGDAQGHQARPPLRASAEWARDAVAPSATRLEVARAYAVSKLGWIREQQAKLADQARETPRQFVERESHYLWGRRHLLTVVYRDGQALRCARPQADHPHRAPGQRCRRSAPRSCTSGTSRCCTRRCRRSSRNGSESSRSRLRGYFLQRMKTKWGSCNHRRGHIRLNTELVKKPKDLLEYVVVHEMVHLIEPTHSDRFIAILAEHYPTWREARAELNELPLGARRCRARTGHRQVTHAAVRSDTLRPCRHDAGVFGR